MWLVVWFLLSRVLCGVCIFICKMLFNLVNIFIVMIIFNYFWRKLGLVGCFCFVGNWGLEWNLFEVIE